MDVFFITVIFIAFCITIVAILSNKNGPDGGLHAIDVLGSIARALVKTISKN
jgi:hypothetical protein